MMQNRIIKAKGISQLSKSDLIIQWIFQSFSRGESNDFTKTGDDLKKTYDYWQTAITVTIN